MGNRRVGVLLPVLRITLAFVVCSHFSDFMASFLFLFFLCFTRGIFRKEGGVCYLGQMFLSQIFVFPLVCENPMFRFEGALTVLVSHLY